LCSFGELRRQDGAQVNHILILPRPVTGEEPCIPYPILSDLTASHQFRPQMENSLISFPLLPKYMRVFITGCDKNGAVPLLSGIN